MNKKFTTTEKQDFVKKYYNGESTESICTNHSIPKSTFYSWLSDHRISDVARQKIVSIREYQKLIEHLQKLEKIIEVLKIVNCTNHAPLQEKLSELVLLHDQYSVRVLCEALDVDRGTYYNHIFRNKKENASYQIRRSMLSEKIKDVFHDNNEIFGASKIKAILSEQGIVVSDKMVSQLMQEMNLSSIRTDSKKQYLKQNNDNKKDALKLNFTVKAPNKVWVSDITYFRFNNKTYYICAILDLYARKVVACKISQKQSTQLTSSTFKLAFNQRKPGEGLIFHSDRGGNFMSYSFQTLLKSYHVKQSFSPSGSPQHNAVMESFFASMKKEELYRTNYRGIDDMKNQIQKYIEFYNNRRPHSTINYKTPNAHEAMFYQQQYESEKLDKGVQKS